MSKFKRRVSLVMAILMLLIYAPLPSAIAALIPTDATFSPESRAACKPGGTNFRPQAEEANAFQCVDRCGSNRVQSTRFDDNRTVADQRTRIKTFLQRAEVIQIISARGIDPAEAANRVASLTDAEVDRLARKIDQLPAGGSFIGTIAMIGVIFFLVLILLELTGFIDVFTFINSPRR